MLRISYTREETIELKICYPLIVWYNNTYMMSMRRREGIKLRLSRLFKKLNPVMAENIAGYYVTYLEDY